MIARRAAAALMEVLNQPLTKAINSVLGGLSLLFLLCGPLAGTGCFLGGAAAALCYYAMLTSSVSRHIALVIFALYDDKFFAIFA